jgi:plasmid stability protein
LPPVPDPEARASLAMSAAKPATAGLQSVHAYAMIIECTFETTTEGIPMISLTIRKLDPAVKERLRLRAARHGRSMEEEARQILSEACQPEQKVRNAFEALRQPFAGLGAVDLALPDRKPGRAPPDLD